MAVVDHNYVADGTTRIFTSDWEIFSDNHVRVFTGNVEDLTEVFKSQYDIVNNAVVFDTAPLAGTQLTIQVATGLDDLLYTLTEVGVVASNIETIQSLGQNLSNINTVSSNSTNINTVASNIAKINTVYSNIDDVKVTSENVSDINDVADRLGNIVTVSGNLANINTVAGNTTNINTVASDSADINTVAGISPNVVAVSNNASNINTVASAATNVNTVSTNINKVSTVATNINNVNTVGNSISNVNAVAGNYTSINTVAGNTTNITKVADISTKVSTVADNIPQVDIVSGSIDDILTVSGSAASLKILADDLTAIGIDNVDDLGFITDPVENIEPGGVSYLQLAVENLDTILAASGFAEDAAASATDALASENAASASETAAASSATAALASKNAAHASELAASSSANAASNSASASATSAGNALTSEQNALASKNAASASATAASGSASAAGASETNALSYKNSASASASAASTSASNAASSETNALTYKNAAQASATAASASEVLAQKWAEEEHGVPVTTGEYSAKHWATEAATIVTEGVIDDTNVSLIKTYSSNKIEGALAVKADASLLAANINVYATTAASDISGYTRLVSTTDDADYNTTAVDVTVGPVTTTNQLLGSNIADAGLFVGNPGVINIITIGNVKHLSGNSYAQFFFRVYKRDASGTEVLIAESNATTPVESATYEQFYANLLFSNGEFTSTDRLVIKFYGSKVGTNSSSTYAFQFGGGNPVRTLLPVPASVLVDPNIAAHLINTSNPHSVTKAQVGLGNADNTSDANKPISTATQTALNLKADASAVYTKAQVDTNVSNAVAGIVNAAPSALNTLNELANALGNDANFSTTITNLIGTKLNSSSFTADQIITLLNNSSNFTLDLGSV